MNINVGDYIFCFYRGRPPCRVCHVDRAIDDSSWIITIDGWSGSSSIRDRDVKHIWKRKPSRKMVQATREHFEYLHKQTKITDGPGI